MDKINLVQKPTLLGKILQYKYFLIAFCFLAVIILLLFWFLSEIKIKGKSINILSPIGFNNSRKLNNPLIDQILSSKSTDKYPPNEYFPFNLSPLYEDNFAIRVDAYAVMDRDKKELLYSKNLTQEVPIASLTKIMTAIIALENVPLNLEVIISSSAATVGEATMGLTSGEKLSVEDLLYGSLLPSGNDAAETIAESIGKYQKGIVMDNTDGGGAREWFISEMNKKAQSLGMLDTYFFNPTGLDGKNLKNTSFSTALDLLALTNYALNNPTFQKIVATKSKVIPYKDNEHKAYFLDNILSLSESFPGIKGVKPGISNFAKETLVSYIERDGRKIIVIILGSLHTKDDVLRIYSRIFNGEKRE